MGRACRAEGAPRPPSGRAGERATPCPRLLVPGVVGASGRESRNQLSSHGQPLWGREVGAERRVCGQCRVMGRRRRGRALDSRVSPNGGLCAHLEAAGSVGRSDPQGPTLVGRGVGAGKWREGTGPEARSFTPIRSFSFIEAGSWGQCRSSARNGVPPSETESRECNIIQC